jgi:hypothetical protein
VAKGRVDENVKIYIAGAGYDNVAHGVGGTTDSQHELEKAEGPRVYCSVDPDKTPGPFRLVPFLKRGERLCGAVVEETLERWLTGSCHRNLTRATP